MRVRHLKERRGDKEGGHENDRQLVCERERKGERERDMENERVGEGEIRQKAYKDR